MPKLSKIPLPLRFHPFNSVLFILLIVTGSLKAQTSSLGLWTGIDTDLRLTKKLELGVKGQVRFSDNIQVTRAFLGEAGLTYKLNKSFSASAYYRYIGRLKKNSDKTGYYYRPYHRFYAEMAYKQKLWHGIKLNYRIRYQNQFMDDNESVVADKSYLRNKLELSYGNKSPFTPFVSADLFYRIDNSDGTNGFDQIRYKAGTNIQLNKKHSVDLFFFLDAPLGDNTDAVQPVIGATYKLDLSLIKRKAKKGKQ